MFVIVSYIIQCLYSPLQLVCLYSAMVIILLILFKWMYNKPPLEQRTKHCLPCDLLFPEHYKHCYTCHTCVPFGYKHVRLFRRCFDVDTYLIWCTIRNTLLFVFCIYNISMHMYSKIFMDVILILLSYL